MDVADYNAIKEGSMGVLSCEMKSDRNNVENHRENCNLGCVGNRPVKPVISGNSGVIPCPRAFHSPHRSPGPLNDLHIARGKPADLSIGQPDLPPLPHGIEYIDLHALMDAEGVRALGARSALAG